MILGITGRAGSGKDTLCKAITSYRNHIVAKGDTRRIAFGDIIRDIVEAAFGSRYETQLEKADTDPFWQQRIGNIHPMQPTLLGSAPVTGRRILQYVGTDLFRQHVHPNFWLFAMERRLADCEYHVVIPDVRFDNEAEWIRAQGGQVVGIIRAGQEHIAESDHVSEQGIRPELISERKLCHSVAEVEAWGAELAKAYFR
jgi:hypothetical protein